MTASCSAGGDEAVAQAGLREASSAGVALAVQPRPRSAREVVGGALALAAARPRDDGAVARAHELLELGLGLLERARGEVGGLGAELDAAGRRRSSVRRTRARASSAARDRVGLDVEVVGVVVVEGGADVLPVVGERRARRPPRRRSTIGVRRAARSRKRVEAVDRQQLGDVGAVLGVLERGDLGQLAVLGGELGGGRDLDRVGLAEASAG